ncbi:hypothetical protein DSO57_1032314 [Entomophthora muscae]|uniref:Uncharacterized protein n=1 Tax=Entomophthora muscae TaxID=34485 RepID=A0ACC2TM83_9FUNG|nr:hypothetical protein DSO57_1032314 [Entomophthora muscae]
MFHQSLLFKKDGNLLPHQQIKTAPPPIQTNCGEEYEVKYIHGNQTHYQKPQYYAKWKRYPLEENTWELLSSLTNAQEAIQLYLNKKNWEGGSLGEEGNDVRIDNSPPLEPQAQERELNLELGIPWAAGPMNCGTACPHFSGVKPPQADAEDDGPSSETDQAEEIIALSRVPITTPNGGNQETTISFMSLKSTSATN